MRDLGQEAGERKKKGGGGGEIEMNGQNAVG